MTKDLVRVTAPAEGLLDLTRVKQHLKVSHDEHDAEISAFMAAVEESLDGYAGTLGRALVNQTWELALECWPWRPLAMTQHRASRIELPLPPLVSVDQVTYVDLNGAPQILPDDQYQVLSGPVAAIDPAYGVSWPRARRQARAVTVRFTCGYGTPDEVPGGILTAAMMMVSDLYENRSSQFVNAGTLSVLPNAQVDRLLRRYRIPKT